MVTRRSDLQDDDLSDDDLSVFPIGVICNDLAMLKCPKEQIQQ